MEILIWCVLVYLAIGLVYSFIIEDGDLLMIVFWLPWILIVVMVLVALAGKNRDPEK